MIDYVRTWADKTELHAKTLVGWIGIPRSKYYQWRQRYGQVNEHNARIPRDHWLEDWEKQTIVAYHQDNPLEGYRRLTYMMIDADIVAVSPSSVYRVLKTAGLLGRWNARPSGKGTGFQQPLGPHELWHIDLAYLNICGTFTTCAASWTASANPSPITTRSACTARSSTSRRLAGRAEAILSARDAKLTAAREARKARRQQEPIGA